ncbi:hypothetical protein CEXT_713611 [Caerostris extrusa]|uniref:Uncharacterized protein n=1 Tax=Caerostris extrusa TaxID=172846 RepID=A0AAV4N3M8_CAEEX|nr:hypothetical protein CEXT_713611 [Caerostris extrusa]
MYALRKPRAQNTVRRTKPRIRNNPSSICHFGIRLNPPTSALSLVTKRIFVVRCFDVLDELIYIYGERETGQ